MADAPRSMAARPGGPLTGTLAVPGDKSISHRALMLGALSVGETRIAGLLDSADVAATATAVEALGATVERGDSTRLQGRLQGRLWGRGVAGLAEPADVLDMGNAGTAARLMLGLLAGQPVTAFLTGDASLRGRPMNRVTGPLTEMGAVVVARRGGRLPLAITGRADLLPYDGVLPVASAQVKSAILLAGLTAPGRTRVVEPAPTRDHTERMLTAFGAQLTVEDTEAGREIRLDGEAELTARPVDVPADPSSAAFPLVAALLVPGSEVHLPAIGMNPHRTGLVTTLREMGAAIEIANEREQAGEPIADITARAGTLRGVEVPAERAPSMIDEYPVLAMAAACADGPTTMHGVGELRVKESDRIAALADGLAACGVEVEAGDDWLTVHGRGGPVPGGAEVAARMDHRIAMSFLVLGLASRHGTAVDDAGAIATSFPGFAELMQRAGAAVAAAG